jgi:hypothetical protein
MSADGVSGWMVTVVSVLTVIGQRATVFKLLASEDQALLVWRDTLLVLDLGLDVIDGI